MHENNQGRSRTQQPIDDMLNLSPVRAEVAQAEMTSASGGDTVLGSAGAASSFENPTYQMRSNAMKSDDFSGHSTCLANTTQENFAEATSLIFLCPTISESSTITRTYLESNRRRRSTTS